jgi:hypothetical protein
MDRTADVARMKRIPQGRRWLPALIALVSTMLLVTAAASAGPPFETDDPEPVECHHVEVDVAQARQSEPVVTGPAWEIDYGPAKNVEVSVGAQPHETEIGSAIRFVPETKNQPQIGILPTVAIQNNGKVETSFPIWAQKTVGAWTVFGGGGISFGSEFTGLSVTRNFRSGSTLGVEIYHESQRNPTLPVPARMGIGYVDQLGPSNAIMLWAGRALQPRGTNLLYVGFRTTFSRAKPSSSCG